MRRSLALAALALGLGVGACQRAPETQAPPPASAVDHVAEARRALAAQNWAVAAQHLRAALPKDPQSLFLHFNLAICATWLDLKDEAMREFEWVVARAPGDSEEAKIARSWLAAARDQTPTQQTAAEPAAADPTVGDSGLHGVITWAAEGQSPVPLVRQELYLTGLRGTPTKERIYMARSDKEGRYQFKRVVPGQYQLTDAVAGKARWRLRVEVKAEDDQVIDLTPANGISVRDDFPGSK